MILRTVVCFVMGLALSGCPFALEDDFFIDDQAKSLPSAPAIDAGPPGDASNCPKKGPCPGDECRGRDCLKLP